MAALLMTTFGTSCWSLLTPRTAGSRSQADLGHALPA